jgi:hypothetical protein
MADRDSALRRRWPLGGRWRSAGRGSAGRRRAPKQPAAGRRGQQRGRWGAAGPGGGRRPCRRRGGRLGTPGAVGAQGRGSAAAVAEAAGDGTHVDAGGDELGGRVVTQPPRGFSSATGSQHPAGPAAAAHRAPARGRRPPEGRPPLAPAQRPLPGPAVRCGAPVDVPRRPLYPRWCRATRSRSSAATVRTSPSDRPGCSGRHRVSPARASVRGSGPEEPYSGTVCSGA